MKDLQEPNTNNYFKYFQGLEIGLPNFKGFQGLSIWLQTPLLQYKVTTNPKLCFAVLSTISKHLEIFPVRA